jgi:hypothetical protein
MSYVAAHSEQCILVPAEIDGLQGNDHAFVYVFSLTMGALN